LINIKKLYFLFEIKFIIINYIYLLIKEFKVNEFCSISFSLSLSFSLFSWILFDLKLKGISKFGYVNKFSKFNLISSLGNLNIFSDIEFKFKLLFSLFSLFSLIHIFLSFSFSFSKSFPFSFSFTFFISFSLLLVLLLVLVYFLLIILFNLLIFLFFSLSWFFEERFSISLKLKLFNFIWSSAKIFFLIKSLNYLLYIILYLFNISI
jgi:hypothetical protein